MARAKEIEKAIIAQEGILLDGVALARVLGCRRETASRWAKANGVERLGSPAKYFSGDVARAIVNGGMRK